MAIGQAVGECHPQSFGLIEVQPAFELNGTGSNVDSIAFWEAESSDESLMFVTAKGNSLIEVWAHPFTGDQISTLTHSSFGDAHVNGVVVDQDRELLYVSTGTPENHVTVFRLPGLEYVTHFGSNNADYGPEPNVALLELPDGTKQLYVSADDVVFVHDANTFDFISEFRPTKGLETMIADDFYQVVYIPDENDRTGVYAYNADGSQYSRNGSTRFGVNVFQSDAEGIALVTCPVGGSVDSGTGFIVVSDQRSDVTEFEFFDRISWEHLGTLRIEGVSNTDGIASTEIAMSGYALGLLAVIDNDTATSGIGWDVVFDATGLLPTGPPSSGEIQLIELAQGWNLTSSYIAPADPSLSSLMGQISDDLVLVKDQDGRIYSPEFGIDDLTEWRSVESYKINVRQIASLSFEGPALDIGTRIALRPGWNLIPFIGRDPIPVETALSSIRDQLVLAKDNLGRVYYPAFNLDSIGDLQPGWGYQVFVNPGAELDYSK